MLDARSYLPKLFGICVVLSAGVFLIMEMNLMEMTQCISVSHCQKKSERNVSVKILFHGTYFFGPWSPLMDNKHYHIGNVICHTSTNATEIEYADAVVFHLRDTGCNIPNYRRPNQHWILHTHESRANDNPASRECSVATFNRSWSFTLSSDALVKYGYVHDVPNMIETTEIPKKKNGLVLWFVSNCGPRSNRNQYAENLANYVDIHIVTKYCHFSNPRIKTISCQDCNALLSEYKFYLAFENSFCEDYVTEKAFRGLIYGAVPIVYGGANYSKFMPKGSFIEGRKFSPEVLGKYILYLDSHDDEYLEFYSWKRTQMVRFLDLEDEVIKLCKKVVEWNNTHKNIGTKNEYLSSLKCE